ncbi:NADPH-dependent 2,4-dienoyl-CoA reductase/sulfur reductase-like enzyme [Chelatococcus caeni]|uniref:NADPH-dependent 2,4-dienoyl-CoA reductase/sulfur reductase-like enzyme n=1 Tax=Chelatococcus caeni TaxID=1348468 RepID=A0A840C5L5_9HYPH|nr:NAD(P)/FAD-dependent oxidoreductase [Chelatococcus caeni]MBB4018898.1 NADPH-dependent 2,4-dienoyl-CoA reductase/sulfur reductase-like enzyme [Chelatococcus caeni]
MAELMAEVVIVGAGPAGIRAAGILAAQGLRPILVDEGRQAGGQGYRRPSPGLALDMDTLMGTEAGKYKALHADFAALLNRIDYRPRTLVWGIEDRRLHCVRDGRQTTIAFDALIVATGAMDRIAPLPGWILPGVFTLGGAQAVLKDQGCLVGRRVAFLGASPLLSLAALQYRKLGAEVVAVCDTSSFRDKIAALPQLAAVPRTLARGIAYLAALKRARVPLFDGVTPLAIEGEAGVTALRFRDGRGHERRIACDAVALGYGLKPETQLAELAGARFAFDARFRLWLPVTDEDGRAGEGLYLAGDGAAIGGADAAEASGALAALAVLHDLGLRSEHDERPALRRRLARLRRFQQGLARAFRWPVAALARLSDEVAVCRCEHVTAGDIRRAMDADLGPVDVNRVKAITRCGMGRCQGRVCGPALQEIAAAHAGLPVEAVGRLRGQAPLKPVPLGILEEEEA